LHRDFRLRKIILRYSPGGWNEEAKRKIMYAVIFKAKLAQIDDAYFKTAKRMRELALGKYGCLEFVSVMEGDV